MALACAIGLCYNQTMAQAKAMLLRGVLSPNPLKHIFNSVFINPPCSSRIAYRDRRYNLAINHRLTQVTAAIYPFLQKSGVHGVTGADS